MGLRIWLMLLALAALLNSACGKTPEGNPQAEDTAVPARIISLTPSATAILEELGALGALVGRDKFSDSPESIRALPVVGDFATPNIEAIIALKPDLVILDASQEKARRALETLDVPTLVLTMHNLRDVSVGLTKVGAAIGKKHVADELTATLQGAFQQISARGQLRKRQPRVLVLIDRAPDSLRNLVAAGPGSYLDELLTMVGATNVMASSNLLYPQLGAEQILRTAPDIIIDVSHAQGSVDAYQLIPEVPAVANKRVFVVDEPSMRAPSPKAAHALERLFALTALYPPAPAN